MQQKTVEMPVQQDIQCEKTQNESSKEGKSAASSHSVKSLHGIKGELADKQDF